MMGDGWASGLIRMAGSLETSAIVGKLKTPDERQCAMQISSPSSIVA
jgi:hypothetical protein